MMKILIFTNKYSFQDLDLDETFIENLKSCYPDKNKPVAKCILKEDAPVELFSVNNCKPNGIYFVFDRANEETFNYLIDQFNEDDSFILVHTSGIWTKNRIPERLKSCCSIGMHENNMSSLYYPVFSILADDKGEKTERIVDILKPLDSEKLKETALRFFSGVSSPKNNSESFVNAKDILVQDPEFGTDVRDFYENKYMKSNNYNDYFAEFRILVKTVTDIIIDRSRKEKLAKRNQ